MSRNIIVMNRGDSNTIKVFLGDLKIPPFCNDVSIYFGVMLPRQKFEDAVIRKKYTYDDCDECGNLFIELKPEDTLNLDPATYYYAVKVKILDNVCTLINKTKFILND